MFQKEGNDFRVCVISIHVTKDLDKVRHYMKRDLYRRRWMWLHATVVHEGSWTARCKPCWCFTCLWLRMLWQFGLRYKSCLSKHALASPCLFHFKLWGAVFLQASMRGWFQAHSWLFFKLLTTAMNMQAQRGRFFFSGLELTCLRKASHVSWFKEVAFLARRLHGSICSRMSQGFKEVTCMCNKIWLKRPQHVMCTRNKIYVHICPNMSRACATIATAQT